MSSLYRRVGSGLVGRWLVGRGLRGSDLVGGGLVESGLFIVILVLSLIFLDRGSDTGLITLSLLSFSSSRLI